MADLIQTAMSAGEISDDLMGRVDLDWYRIALARCRNAIVHPHGGVSNRAGTHFVTKVHDSTKKSRLIDFQFSNIQTYVLEFGDYIMRVIKDQGLVLEAAKSITSATQANPVVLGIASHGYSSGNEVFISGVSGMTELNGRTYKVTVVNTNTISIDVNGSGFSAYSGGGTVKRVFELTTPYSVEEVQDLNFVQSADVMFFAHPNHPPQELARYDHDDWTIGAMDFTPQIAAPTGTITGTASDTSTPTVNLRYVITAEAEDGSESLASAELAVTVQDMSHGSHVDIVWPSVTGAVRYNIYKEANNSGVFGWIGRATKLTFRDKNIEPDVTATPLSSTHNPFGSAGSYPAAVSFYEERLVFASTYNNPQTVYMSQTGRYSNFSVSKPPRDDEAVQFTPISRKVSPIKNLVDLNDLILFTNDNEWRVHGGNQGDPITPSSINPKRQTGWGSSPVTPILIGDIIVYVQRGGRKVRALGYNLESDGYKGNDLTIRVPHFFEDGNTTIVDMVYAQEPFSVVWCVLSNGKLAAFTYIQEQNVWAWHYHETDGFVENITVITEDGYETPYLVVRRHIDGSDVRYIEKMDNRRFTDVEDGFFVDCGLRYSGPEIASVSGLDHLEGKTVAVLGDGNEQNQKTVVNGRITLDKPSSKLSIGLPYLSYIKTLRAALNAPAGAQNKMKSIKNVTLRVKNTRGIKVGPSLIELQEVKPAYFEPDKPMAMFTGDLKDETYSSSWESSGQFYIAQSSPLPMTVVAIIPEVRISG